MKLGRFAYRVTAGAIASIFLAGNVVAQTLFVSDAGTNRVDEYSYQTATNTYTLTAALSGSAFNNPQGLAFSAATNTLYIANDNSIAQFNLTTRSLTNFATQQGIAQINGLALDSSGNLYASNQTSGNGNILELSTAGANAGTVINSISTLNIYSLKGPTGLAFNSGDLFVGSSQNGSVFQITPSGNVLQSFTGTTSPAGVSVGTDGSVYYANLLPTGTIPNTGSGPGFTAFTPSNAQYFATPSSSRPDGIIVAPDSNLLMTDSAAGTITEYSNLNFGNGSYTASTKITGLVDPTYLLFAPTVLPTTTIPEPATIGMTVLIGASLLGRRRRQIEA